MGFTTEAVAKNPGLLPDGADRAWEVWDRPPETVPSTVRAFQLVFPTTELAVSPADRQNKRWSEVIFIEAAPPGKLTVLSLFITRGNIKLKHESQPSFCLAALDLGNGYYANLVAHGESEGNLPQVIAKNVTEAKRKLNEVGVAIPDTAYAYFLGHHDDGARFVFGAVLHKERIES